MQLALDLWQHIAEVQNAILAQSPTHEIEINDARMWQDLMDHFDNEHYELLFEILAVYTSQCFIKPHHQTLIDRARDYYRKNQPFSDRAMDRRPRYKQPQWGLMMTLREIWNEAARIPVPRVVHA